MREKIAKGIAEALGMPLPTDGEIYYLLKRRMDAILAIPEIKEALELWEKRERLVELDEDQSWPEHSWQVNHSVSLSRLGEQQVHDRMLGLGWDRAIGECKGAGFRRVVKG